MADDPRAPRGAVPLKVAFCSPREVERDGVGSYARALYPHLSRHCDLEPLPLDAAVHDRAHYDRLAETVNRSDVLHVEHNFALFKLPLYPFREGFRHFLRRVRIPRLVVYHEIFESIPGHNPRKGAAGAERAKGMFLYAAMSAVRPLADHFWLPGFNRDLFALPERVIVHTEFRAAIVRRYVPGARVRVIPHPVYLPADPEEPANSGVPFGGDDFVLTVFGFIERRKDYIGVLEALARLPTRYKLLIAGGCHSEAESASASSTYGSVRRFIRTHSLEGRVHMTGYCADTAISGLMRATTVVIAPFLEDHSSGSVNMAVAHRKPVIAYRTSLTEEMNRNGAGLFLVEGREGLAPALLRAGSDPGWLEGAQAPMRGYRERFGFAAAAARIAEIHREMAAGR